MYTFLDLEDWIRYDELCKPFDLF